MRAISLSRGDIERIERGYKPNTFAIFAAMVRGMVRFYARHYFRD
jgi:hypothetical protein